MLLRVRPSTAQRPQPWSLRSVRDTPALGGTSVNEARVSTKDVRGAQKWFGGPMPRV